jgi:protein gp37
MIGIMAEAERHDFLVLTKRVELLAAFSKGLCHYPRGQRELKAREGWPPNVALVASAEDQPHYDVRVQALVHKVPCPVSNRGVSLEPLLGPVRLGGTGRLHLSWVVVGGESGPGARPMEVEWATDVMLKSRAGDDPIEWPEELRIQEHFAWDIPF